MTPDSQPLSAEPDTMQMALTDVRWHLARYATPTAPILKDFDLIATHVATLTRQLAESEQRAREAETKAAAYDRINTPEIDDFLSAVKNEALHQRERWGVDQDGWKEHADWFWLVGHLAGKALYDVKGKRLHHIITAGAALLNWHAHAIGAYARMRPGIEPPAAEAAHV